MARWLRAVTDLWVVCALAGLTAAVGTLGGLGGAVLLVPMLVLAGWEPSQAAPVGLLMVGAASMAAAPTHAGEHLVHTRLGVTVEVGAGAGAVLGAWLSLMVDAAVATNILGAAAITAALLGGLRRGVRNPPDPTLSGHDVGERPDGLAGTYRLPDGIVAYRARRVPLGMLLCASAGLVAGMTGTSGGYLKTPIISEVMRVPVKVAAATTTMTVGITAAAALAVYGTQGRLDLAVVAPVLLGGLVGGRVGAGLLKRLPPTNVRRVLSGLLLLIGVLLVVRGVAA